MDASFPLNIKHHDAGRVPHIRWQLTDEALSFVSANVLILFGQHRLWVWIFASTHGPRSPAALF